MSNARLGTFEDLLAEMPAETAPHVADTMRAVRAVVLAGLPDAVEVVRLGDRAASYGVGPKKMSESHVYLMPRKGYATLGFWHGVALPDPAGLLDGTGKRMRHVKLHGVAEAERPEVAALIAAALEERRAALAR